MVLKRAPFPYSHTENLRMAFSIFFLEFFLFFKTFFLDQFSLICPLDFALHVRPMRLVVHFVGFFAKISG